MIDVRYASLTVKFEPLFCSVNCAESALFSVITLLLHFLRIPETSPNNGILKLRGGINEKL